MKLEEGKKKLNGENRESLKDLDSKKKTEGLPLEVKLGITNYSRFFFFL